MNIIRAFFPLLGHFFQFSKKEGDTFPLNPNSALDTSPDIRMRPKAIASTSHHNFNNSMKIVAEKP